MRPPSSGPKRARAPRADRLGVLIPELFEGVGPDALPAGRVFAGGRRAVDPELRVEAGTALLLHAHPPGDSPTIEVLFEDERLLVVNKPAGIAVNATETASRMSVVELFAERDARVVHRLDRDTTGALVLAKGPRMAAELSAAFAERRVEKTYLAVVEGAGLNERIEAPIGKDKRRPRARAVRPGGQPATSVVKTLAARGPLALVEVDLLTGRTHQIRVHLAHRGQPIFGDTLYGGTVAQRLDGEVLRPERGLLHAARLALPGFGDDAQVFVAPEPDDFAAVAGRLRAGPTD